MSADNERPTGEVQPDEAQAAAEQEREDQSAGEAPESPEAPDSPEATDADQADAEPEPQIEVTPKMLRKLRDDDLMDLAQRAADAEHFKTVAARNQAELENYRKRMERQRQDDAKYAIVPFVREVLGSLDNLDRAIQAAKQSEESGPLLDGVVMTRDLLIKSLAKFKVEEIDASDADFDPEFHDAVMMGSDPDRPDNAVLDCYETGWKLHDRVIRPAKVRVNKHEG